jgi:hypothetical protein
MQNGVIHSSFLKYSYTVHILLQYLARRMQRRLRLLLRAICPTRTKYQYCLSLV